MNVNRSAVLLTIAVLVVIGAVALFVSYRGPVKDTAPKQGVTTAPTTTNSAMRFEIADTMAKQSLGLGNRSSIEDNYGMLFVFKDKDRYGFWMKDMLAPIDITWLKDDGTILLIDHSVDPSTYPHIFYPPVPVMYVLETRAGYAKDHGWDVGTKVALPAPYGT